MKTWPGSSRALSAAAIVASVLASQCSSHGTDFRCDMPCALISESDCAKAAKNAGCASYKITESAQRCDGVNALTVPDGCVFKDCGDELTCPGYAVLTGKPE